VSRRRPTAAALAGAAAAWALGAAAWTPAAAASVPTTAANRALAHADAQTLLGRVRLRPFSVATAREPHGDHRMLKPVPALTLWAARADARQWWIVPGAAILVYGFIQAHRPRGAKLLSYGRSFDGESGATSWNAAYLFPAVTGRLGWRELTVTVTALPGDRTGLLAQAESVWIVTRPPSERIPAGVGEVDVTKAVPGEPPTVSLSVSRPRLVGAIVARIDRLPAAQPTTLSCPADTPAPPVATFTFRTGSGGAVLAQATEAVEQASPLGEADACNPIALAIAGAGQPPLGGSFLAPVSKLLGVDLG
jgi:hypothetical protein